MRTVVFAEATPTFDVGGSQLQFVAPPDLIGSESMSILRGTLPVGGIVPLHSHSDSESFYVLCGEMEAYLDDSKSPGWQRVKPGELAVIRGDVKHAWRNMASEPCVALVFTGKAVCNFLQELARPLDAAPAHDASGPEQMEKMAVLAMMFSQWLATPEENAAIGLTVPS